MKKQKLLGYFSVDSGTVLITDPCYVLGDTIDPAESEKKYIEIGQGLEKKQNTITIAPPHGSAVFSSTGYGDGLYPVYAEYKDQCVSRLIIDFKI